MKKFLSLIITAIFLSSCSNFSDDEYYQPEPEYNRLARHIHIVDKTSNFIVYEYKDIRIDEVAPIASLYCEDNGGKQASLYDISMRPDKTRRASFICR